MARKHLADEEIQELLDHRHRNKQAASPVDDLDNASRENLFRYEALYQALHQDIPVELSPGFTDTVLNKIRQSANTYPALELLQLVLTLLGFAAGIGLTIYYTGFKFFANYQVDLTKATAAIAKLSELFTGLTVNFSYLVIAILILAVFNAADQFINHIFNRAGRKF